MRIFIFIDQMTRVGGTERVAANLCRAWAHSGAEITILTLNPGPEGFAMPASVVRRNLSNRSKRLGLAGVLDSLMNGFRLGRLLREVNPDVVVALGTVASLQLAFARAGKATIKVGSEHAYARHYVLPAHVKIARRLLYPCLDALVCPASRTALAVSQDCPGTNAVAIPNPLTLPLGSSGLPVPTSRLLKPGRRYFCTSARLEPLKRIDQLLEAFRMIKSELPEWDLLVLGDGPLRRQLEAKAGEMGLEGRVFFVGWVGNSSEWYEAADLFVFSSHSEGFGMVLAEAMAHGLPCVTYDCDAGPADIVRDGLDGAVVPVGDVRALSGKMKKLALDDGLRGEYSRKSREVVGRFSEEAVLGEWHQLFARCLAKRTKRDALKT